MATLQEQLNRVKKLNPERISRILFDSVREIENQIIELNTKGQLFKGTDSEGNRLYNKRTKSSVYSSLTEVISGGKKKAGTPYTLEDTGDFYKGFFINIEKDKAVIGSKDSKTALLEADYGEIFGLTDKNLKAVIQEKILPLLQKEIRRTLGI